ncbi:hypothetical protein FG386_002572 [Cryptosporidium ryanae]|uniref:uncharacterized protein n=1 Tax=Cryptosporidium ryanae TaxID=515981 RepID=UPI003519FDA8|nr:hypothetical protein FG386_002572 [Cryptosporidium ryanae]
MDGLPIPEIYINSDMILSFEEDNNDWNESNANLITNPSKSLTTNLQSTSNKLNVNVNVNVNGNVNYNHNNNSMCNYIPNNSMEDSNASIEIGNLGNNDSEKRTVVNNRIPVNQNLFIDDDILKSEKISSHEIKDEAQNLKIDKNFQTEKTYNSQFGSLVLNGFQEQVLEEKNNFENETKVIKRRRGDPKLCWRCHKRDATPHMRSCEPCRVADRQRWSRRRSLSKFMSENSNNVTHLNLNNVYNLNCKQESFKCLNSDNLREYSHNNCFQNKIQMKHEKSQYMIGNNEAIKTINSNISHSNNSSSVQGISLTCPILIENKCDQQQFSLYRDNRILQCSDLSQNLSYITITYYPSSFSGLTSIPVCARFASDGTINGLEALPSVVLSFIVDKCNEQLLQRQVFRQGNQQHVNNNGLISPQLESGVGKVSTNNNEIHKGVICGSGTGNNNTFHNMHCTNFHCSQLDPRFYG